jgi:hypothetical protein
MKKSLKSYRWLGLIVQCAVGILLLWWLVVWSKVDGRHLVQRFAQASLWLLALSILCFIVVTWVRALQYRLFLPSTMPITYLMGATLCQNALLTFIPWRIGEMSYPLLLRRDYGIPLSSSGAVILTIRLVDLLVILIVSLIGGKNLDFDMRWANILFSATVLLAVVAAIVLFRLRHRAPLLLRTAINALKPLRQPERLVSMVLLSVATFILSVIQSAFVLRAMSLPITPLDVALLSALGLLASLLPIHPPGGWGTMDSIQIAILDRLGYHPEMSTPSVLAAHSFYTLTIFMGGIIGWLLRTKSLPTLKAGA